MLHDHHRCECAHERLKFCKPCGVVFCVDCKVEWVTRPFAFQWSSPSYTLLGSAGASATQATLDLTPIITCEGH